MTLKKVIIYKKDHNPFIYSKRKIKKLKKRRCNLIFMMIENKRKELKIFNCM